MNCKKILFWWIVLVLGLVSCSQARSVPNEPVLSTKMALSRGVSPTISPVITIITPSPRVMSILPATHIPTMALTPSSTPTPTPTVDACLLQRGRVEITEISSDILSYPLSFRLYLPPCYEEHAEQDYPVLYLIHGQSFNDDQWDRLGIDEVADRLITAGEILPLIVVMPRDRLWSQPYDDLFGEALIKELIPLVDDQYRTRTARAYRAIGGLSRGGSWAIHLGVSQWQYFSAVGGHSAPIFWDDASKIRRWIEAIPPESMPRFYLDIGDNDRPEIAESAIGFEKLLTRFGIVHEWHVFSGYHVEDYWAAHTEQYLRWYVSNWEDK